jgi:hypothetical protein
MMGPPPEPVQLYNRSKGPSFPIQPYGSFLKPEASPIDHNRSSATSSNPNKLQERFHVHFRVNIDCVLGEKDLRQLVSQELQCAPTDFAWKVLLPNDKFPNTKIHLFFPNQPEKTREAHRILVQAPNLKRFISEVRCSVSFATVRTQQQGAAKSSAPLRTQATPVSIPSSTEVSKAGLQGARPANQVSKEPDQRHENSETVTTSADRSPISEKSKSRGRFGRRKNNQEVGEEDSFSE